MMRLSPFFFGCTFVASTLLFSGTVLSSPKQSSAGYMRMGGNIIESACAIHPDSHQQSIVLNDVSADTIIKRGSGELHPFNIKLFNCSLARAGGRSWVAFEITFHGEADGKNFALLGESKGMAIEIRDDRGFIAIPGVAMPPHPVPEGNKTLGYNIRLIGNSQLLRGGSHFTSLNYKLDYY